MFLDGPTKVFCLGFLGRYPERLVFIAKFRMSEHDMPCACEPNSNDGFKREHLESCPSTTKNIVSPLQQYIWPPDLGGWLLTMRAPITNLPDS